MGLHFAFLLVRDLKTKILNFGIFRIGGRKIEEFHIPTFLLELEQMTDERRFY